MLTSVQNTEVNRTERKNSSWSAGVFAGKSGGSYGFGIEGAGAIGKGRENSDTVTQVNTHITGSRVKLHSEQDTALRGAVVNANKLNADIGGNLTIESRQDSNRYASRQSQANAGASIAIYGSGSNAYAGTSLNKGKVNYAQVEEQSGLTVGKDGMDVNVQGHTHLKGGLIQSEAPADKNRFRTDGLTTEDIENHSEISLQSLGGGISSDMFSGDMVGSLGKLGSANGWSAVVSALGGVNRDDKTLTRSAIGDNIALEIKTHEIPTALSRDTAHSNANVQRYDKAEYEERLETAQLIGDISQNQIDIQWTPKVREAEAKRQQAEAVLNNQNATTAEKAEAGQIKSQSEQIIATYGKGGDYQLAVRAVTGVLQGLATGNQNAAWVNGLSPYANNLIKTYTTDEQGQVNTTANLMAHAMLGALEAYATGNHAAAGAAGAITSEVAAKFITEQLYHTEPDKLTDDQKQVVATLSQVTAGLAGIVASDSTQSAVSAAEIGKRAVENNYLNEIEANKFIEEYDSAKNNEEKREILVKYTLMSKENDNIFVDTCSIDPVECINLINQARAGTEKLVQVQSNFGLSPYFKTILNSNYRAENNKEWLDTNFMDLIPNKIKNIQPNQELANKLAQGISTGTVVLSKKSADLLYQLNTDPNLVVNYDPSNIKVKLTEYDREKNRYGGRVAYSDTANWSVFGSIVANQRENGNIHIYDDKYDYDIRGGYKNLLRDTETYLGRPSGIGTPYLFQFDRDKKVILDGDLPK